MISLRTRVLLRVQRGLGHVLFFFVGTLVLVAMHFYWRYHIAGRKDLRRHFDQITQAHDGPMLLCANHLTIMDTALAAWALASNWTYLRRFRLLAWSVPDLHRAPLVTRILCYLNKCIPIVRSGTPKDKRMVMAKLTHVLQQGNVVSIFPEGTRSRSGRLDMENFGYGVGQLVTSTQNVGVLCLYLRGDKQKTWSTYPARNDNFYVAMQFIKPQSNHKGMRAARDISFQVMNTLHGMEQQYFEQHGSGAKSSPPSSLTPLQPRT